MAITISIVILLFSVILHEIAHGAVAEYFGDDTARLMGRITLNPLKHIDPYFTILIPLLLIYSGSPVIFGAAKPVPVNYNNFRKLRAGVFWVSIAGVLANFLLATVFAFFIHFLQLSETVKNVFMLVVTLNVYLAVINMIPLPPIDGSKVLAAIFGEYWIQRIMNIEMRGLVGILPFIVIIYFLFASSGFNLILQPAAAFIFRLLGL